jgi:hypothetical protein
MATRKAGFQVNICQLKESKTHAEPCEFMREKAFRQSSENIFPSFRR